MHLLPGIIRPLGDINRLTSRQEELHEYFSLLNTLMSAYWTTLNRNSHDHGHQTHFQHYKYCHNTHREPIKFGFNLFLAHLIFLIVGIGLFRRVAFSNIGLHTTTNL